MQAMHDLSIGVATDQASGVVHAHGDGQENAERDDSFENAGMPHYLAIQMAIHPSSLC
jgi:hypothetical protein